MKDKRTKLVEASLKLFCELGFQNTSTALISKQANVATGTLFLYFPTKEKLINSLYIEAKQEFSEYLQDGLSKQKTIKSKIKHVWLRANEWALRKPYSFQFIHMFSSSPYITKLAKKEVSSMADFADKIVRAAIKEKVIAKISIPLFYAYFDGVWTATVMHCASLKSKKSKDKLVLQSFELFWKGISS